METIDNILKILIDAGKFKFQAPSSLEREWND